VIHAVPIVRVRWNGLNQSVALTVLLTSRLAMLAARTFSETASVIRSLFYRPLHRLATNKSSAVVEMSDDRGHSRHGPKRGSAGAVPLSRRSLVPV